MPLLAPVTTATRASNRPTLLLTPVGQGAPPSCPRSAQSRGAHACSLLSATIITHVKLLISVTDPAEAADAAAAGAQILDVKDPGAGSLGQAPPAWVQAIRAVAPSHLPVSAALGDGPFEAHALARAARALADSGAAYVKVGVRDTAASAALHTLRAVRAQLPPGVGLIAVGFADFARAGCPEPAELPALAAASGADGCLVDT